MFAFDLRALAALRAPERAFLSVYLATPDDVRLLDHRFDTLRALLADEEVEREHFEENLKLLRPLLDGRFEGQSRALFVCWALEYAQAVDLPVAVETVVRVEAAPYLRPLAELEDEYEDFAVVMADNTSAEVYFVSGAEMEEARRVRGDVKNRVKKGGWSQKRYARRREKELHAYAAEVAAALEALHDASPFERLVLLGSDEALQAIEAALSAPMQERLVARAPVDLGEDAEALREATFDAYFEGERASEENLWTRIKEAYFAGGLAVAGPTHVTKAALEGRVEVMLVARDAKIAGTRCRACEHLAHGTPATCYRCGSSDLFQVDLVNDLVEQLALTSAEADFVDPFEALEEVGRVAALLRY